ncbi:hypothetical protein RJ639_003478 [Escallonia herrerae]|uniref:Growth-regulating factor n=1 Tax=Escallonia herrerae TaxID=1293975 RepID=A0AA88W2V2_9ASTE|nr:hypothetical protein RJ639_003478 [Escallonia herrerae]
MGSGDRSWGSEKGAAAASLEYCEVGLGLKMQQNDLYNGCSSSSSGRKMMVMPHLPYHHHLSSGDSGFGGDFGDGSNGNGSGSGGGPLFSNTSNNQVAFLSGLYDAVGAAPASGGTAAVLSRTLHPFPPDTPFRSSSGGGMAASGKVVFTASQRQELERQNRIYEYMMASIPVPPQLLIPITKSPSHVSVSQSNTSGLDLRFSNGSGPEPWRCRRTDGKKWRCSRDVAPDQKYCERHAHKSRSRSRKPVEIQSHNTTNITNNNNLFLPAYTSSAAQSIQKPCSQFSTLVSASSYDQPTRCIEWLMKRGTIPVSTSNHQGQQLMPPSSSSSRVVGTKRGSTDHSKSVSCFRQHYGEEHERMNSNLYGYSGQRFGNQVPDHCSLIHHPKLACLQGSADGNRTQTRHFIDGWSAGDREEEFSNECSLTLSMSGGNGIDEDNEEHDALLGVGMINSERGSDGTLKSSQWLNPVPWMDSPPGGPLGEALCLGIASTAKVPSSLPSPHGYNNSNSTTTSSCSKSSCEDGGHGHNFISPTVDVVFYDNALKMPSYF